MLPEDNGDDAYEAHPILFHRERIPRRPNRLDLNVAFTVRRTRRAVGYEQEKPDEDDGDCGNGQRDGEPLAPIQCWIHVVDRDEVLR